MARCPSEASRIRKRETDLLDLPQIRDRRSGFWEPVRVLGECPLQIIERILGSGSVQSAHLRQEPLTNLQVERLKRSEQIGRSACHEFLNGLAATRRDGCAETCEALLNAVPEFGDI